MKYKCPFCRRKLSLNALKQHVKMHSKSIMVLTPLEYEIYLELKKRGLNPCYPSYVREVSSYVWKISKCQQFLRKLGHKQELGYNLRRLILVHQGNKFVVVRVIE